MSALRKSNVLKLLYSVILLIFLIPFFVEAQDLKGKVVSVADGDTITILDSNKRQHKIRLYGIDCPEGSQAYGNKAKKAISELVYGKMVEVNVLDVDRYGREVGLVFLNNVNINEEMIKQGYAWVFTRYCKIRICSGWETIEAKARSGKLGLWSDSNVIISPWDYRAIQRNIDSPKTTDVESKPKPKKQSTGYSSYHGNKNSKVFHAPGCQDYNCKNCVIEFNSINGAEQAGYRPHKACVK